MTVLLDNGNSTQTAAVPVTGNWTKYLAFGVAAGIAIDGETLEVVLAKSRPNGVTVLARKSVPNFRQRPPAIWGRELREFLSAHGEKHLSATVLLPRQEVIVRVASVPGVQAKDIDGALAFQIDSMHPYGDEEVAFAWSRELATPIAAGNVLVGLIRRSKLDEYVKLFEDAGVAVAGFTFSASAIQSALRLHGGARKDFAAIHLTGDGLIEIYGESSAKPVFSAEFDLAPERAAALAFSELRLAGGEPVAIGALLPVPMKLAPALSSPGAVMAYAVALAPLAHWNSKYANLLPPALRQVHSRARFIPTLILIALLVLSGISWLVYAAYKDRIYLEKLQAEIAKIQPQAARADALDRLANEHKARVTLLDDYRKRGQGDIEILAELSRIIPPTVWTANIDILPDSVMLTGEADQAAPLLKILDSSPYFRNSEFTMGVMRGGQNGEGFRIRTFRKAHK